MSEQDWRNCFGLLQVCLKEVEQRFTNLEAEVQVDERAMSELFHLHVPDADDYPPVRQEEDIERGGMPNQSLSKREAVSALQKHSASHPSSRGRKGPHDCSIVRHAVKDGHVDAFVMLLFVPWVLSSKRTP